MIKLPKKEYILSAFYDARIALTEKLEHSHCKRNRRGCFICRSNDRSKMVLYDLYEALRDGKIKIEKIK